MNQANEPDASSPQVPDGGDPRGFDPTDWALMRWLDGDLDDDEAAAFEARLEDEEELAAKRADLDLTAEVLAELVDEDERGDGIADLVMAKLDEASPAEKGDEAPDEKAPEPLTTAPSLPAPAAKGAANDNARTIFGLAAGAAAVAAGLFFWGMQGDAAKIEARRPPPRQPPVAIAQGPAAAGAEAASAEAVDDEPDASDGDDDPGVEVAAVDFGSHSGSVFYVAGGQSSTAVVWITDGGDE